MNTSKSDPGSAVGMVEEKLERSAATQVPADRSVQITALLSDAVSGIAQFIPATKLPCLSVDGSRRHTFYLELRQSS